MSQQSPYDQPFVPPPPPSLSSLLPPDAAAAKAAAIASDAKNALIMSIIGIFCFGFILGFMAIRKANQALETINTYQVAHDKRSLAMTAKVIGMIDIGLWVVGLLLRLFVIN